jgi:hypothetical protein
LDTVIYSNVSGETNVSVLPEQTVEQHHRDD